MKRKLVVKRISFPHLYISFINHLIAFSCHSDFGCIAKPLSLARNFIREHFETRYLRS